MLFLIAAVAYQATAAEPAPPQTLRIDIPGADPIELVYIRPGAFEMGSDVGLQEQFGPARLRADEGPVRRVKITRGFYIARRKVTCAQFCQFLNAAEVDPANYVNLGKFSRLQLRDGRTVPQPGCENSAVNVVHWQGADAFCDWLGKTSGHDVRLPTEAQWEYAARGDKSRLYPWGDRPSSLAVPAPTANAVESPWDCDAVDAYPANATPEGVDGMVGLEGEWCRDYYADRHLQSDTIDPQGPSRDDLPQPPSSPLLAATTGVYRVMKGRDLAPTKPLASLRAPADRATDAGFYGLRIVVIPPAP